MTIFQSGFFHLHSGSVSSWKVECDNLTEEDIRTLATIVCEHIEFSEVIGVPTGGLRLAEELKQRGYSAGTPPLIVDDVLTTGASMNEMRKQHPDSIGVGIFARGQVPAWISAIWQYGL